MTSSITLATWTGKNNLIQTQKTPLPKAIVAGFCIVFSTGVSLVGLSGSLNKGRVSLITLGAILISLSVSAIIFIIRESVFFKQTKIKVISNFKAEPLLPLHRTEEDLHVIAVPDAQRPYYYFDENEESFF